MTAPYDSVDDIIELKTSEGQVYQWANTNQMCWNHLKLQMLRMWNNEKIKKMLVFTPDY